MNSSPLLRLPPELRNSIYTEVLVEPSSVAVYRPDDLDPRNIWRAPSLLQVCRQIRQEASSIYYGLNTFRFPPPTELVFSYRSYRRRLLGDSRLKDIKVPNPDCITVVAAWLTLLGRETGSLIRTIWLDDTYYHVEKVDPRVAECREHLRRKGIPLPVAEIAVELRSEDLGDSSEVWLSSAFEEVLDSLPQDKHRRDDFIADREAAKIKWA